MTTFGYMWIVVCTETSQILHIFFTLNYGVLHNHVLFGFLSLISSAHDSKRTATYPFITKNITSPPSTFDYKVYIIDHKMNEMISTSYYGYTKTMLSLFIEQGIGKEEGLV